MIIAKNIPATIPTETAPSKFVRTGIVSEKVHKPKHVIQ